MTCDKQTIPRRCQMLRWNAAERSIWDAAQLIERGPADPLLTEAMLTLWKARDLVSEWAEKNPCHDWAKAVEPLERNQ